MLCTTLINEITSLPHDFIVVLDDYHRITGTVVPELFREFERHWPQRMHLVLISRYIPALALASWRAKGQLTEIRARDLRFRPDEAGAYLEMALQRPLSQAAIALVERRTDGWAAGVQLASLLLRDAEDPEGLLVDLAGDDAGFAEYLMDDVLPHQPAAILSFLLQSAIPEQFCVSLCEAVISSDDPEWSVRRCIDWVERHNLFISSLDNQKEWYEYHQMFRDGLLQRARAELGPDRVAELQRRAAAWFASRGLMDEAVPLALAANDRELAVVFMAQGLRNVLNREDRLTLERWLGLFPDEFVQNRPELLVIRGFSLLLAWQWRPLARLLAHTAALLERESITTSAEVEPGALRGCLAVLSALVAYFGSDLDAAAAYSREALALLPEAWSYARSAGVAVQALAMQAGGQGQAARRFLSEKYEGLGDRTTTYALRHLEVLCMIDYRQAGDLEQVMRTGQKLADQAERGRLNLLQSWGHHYVGLARYQRNELAAARQAFARLLDMRYTGNLGPLRGGLQYLALIHQITGEEAEAWGMVQLLSQLDEDQMGYEGEDTRALRALLWLKRGDLEGAVRWAEHFAAPVPEEVWIFENPPHLAKARILLARGTAADVRSALEILTALAVVAERNHNIRLQIEIMALRVLAFDTQGQTGDARDALLAAVELARPGGFVRPFLDLGPRMKDALEQLSRLGDSPNHTMVRRILAEFGDQPTGPEGGQEVKDAVQTLALDSTAGASRSPQPLIETLTPREVEVLLLLRDPLSLKEIAQRLFISYQTVKRHTVHIYAKLDVNKRSAAVAKAKALGLMPPQ